MKRNEFKLLVENWRQNLVLEMDEDMMAADHGVSDEDERPDPFMSGDKFGMRDFSEEVKMIFNLPYDHRKKMLELERIRQLDEPELTNELQKFKDELKEKMSMSTSSGMSMDESLIESDEEISDIEMALEIDKEIDEDDECGY